MALLIKFANIYEYVEPVCRSFHCVKALALPYLSKRATLKAPRRCKYIIPPPYQRKLSEAKEACI